MASLSGTLICLRQIETYSHRKYISPPDATTSPASGGFFTRQNGFDFLAKFDTLEGD